MFHTAVCLTSNVSKPSSSDFPRAAASAAEVTDHTSRCTMIHTLRDLTAVSLLRGEWSFEVDQWLSLVMCDITNAETLKQWHALTLASF